jgi:hypothetical protein
MTTLCLESLIGPKDMCDQSKRNDLKDEMDRHGPRDEFPLTSSCSRSCRSLSYGLAELMVLRDGGRTSM